MINMQHGDGRREMWQIPKRKRPPITGAVFHLVGPHGLEPWTKGLCLPLRLSPPLSGLWSGLYLPITGWPSSLYTFNDATASKLGSVLAYAFLHLAFTDFDQFYLPPEQTWRRATHRNLPCTGVLMFRLVPLSPLL